MTTASIHLDKVCPYCGKPYPIVVIPQLWDIPARTIQSSSCGCDGERNARQANVHNYKLESREKTLRSSGIPKRYWEVPQDTSYIEAIDNGGLFIYGDVGRGKTHLSVAAMKGWMNNNRGKRAVFTDANTMFARIKKSFDTGESEREATWHFSGADLLVFDDFAKGKPSEWSLSKVEEIVNERYNEMRPTIFTSQWAGPELIARLAEGGTEESAIAIVSRIKEMCKMVHLTGPDRRMQ